MTVYICSFLVSCCLLKYVEQKKRNKAYFFVTAIALLIPCLVAAFRAETVGTDVQVYAKPLFDIARKSENIQKFLVSTWYSTASWADKYVGDFEIGFCILVYITAKYIGSFIVCLFLIHALIVIPVYYGLYSFKENIPPWLGMFVFYMMFYNTSLNAMRQWIAAAILFAGFKYLVSGENKKYFAVVLFSMLFHLTGCIGFVIYGMYIFLDKQTNIRFRISSRDTIKANVRVLAITGLGVLLLLFINGAISALNAIGLGKYVGYMQGTFSLLPNQIIIRLPILILLIWRGQYKVKDEPLYNFFLTMMAFDVFASQLASLNENSGRIATYFSEYNMLSIPYAYKAIKNKKTKTLVGGMIITYLIAYWYYNFVISGYSATVPYQFSIG